MKASSQKQVRFAETNSFLVPPVFMGGTSPASSLGPFTPPMYVAGASTYAQPPPPPQRAHTRAHPALESSPILRYDLLDPPSGSALSLRSRDIVPSLTRALDEPATHPPVQAMAIYCTHLPWTIRIVNSSPRGYVTVNDVLVGIYHTLRKQLTDREYALLQSGRDKERAADAYRNRYRRIRDRRAYEDEKSSGMRRVDFLMGNTKFGGLIRSTNAYGEEGWRLSVMK